MTYKAFTMTIAEQINEDIKKAMLAKDKKRLDALRAVKSAILLLATEKGAGATVEDAEAIKAMQKLVKQRKDAAEIYHQQSRTDMAEEEEAQIKVIEEYLPAQMSEQQIRDIVKAKLQELGATGPADMGKVMGPVMGALSGKAEGKVISQIVKEELGK